MKRIELQIEIESDRDLASISLLTGCACDPHYSVQQGQIDPVRKTPSAASRWKITSDTEAKHIGADIESLIARMTNWRTLPEHARRELETVLNIFIYHDLACCSVRIPAETLRFVADIGIDIQVCMIETSAD